MHYELSREIEWTPSILTCFGALLVVIMGLFIVFLIAAPVAVETPKVAPEPNPPLALRFQSVPFKERGDSEEDEWTQTYQFQAARLPDGSHVLWLSESHGAGGIAFIPSTTGWK